MKTGDKVKFKDSTKYDDKEHTILNVQKLPNDTCFFLHYWSWIDEDELILIKEKIDTMNELKVGNVYINNRSNVIATIDSILPKYIIIKGKTITGKNWRTTVTKETFSTNYTLKWTESVSNSTLVGKTFKHKLMPTKLNIVVVRETATAIYYKNIDSTAPFIYHMKLKVFKSNYELVNKSVVVVEQALVKKLVDIVNISKATGISLDVAIVTNKQVDNVVSPSHYNTTKISALDVVNDWELDFYLGNTLKYMKRYKLKGNPLQDLKKAAQYLQLKIELLEKDGKNK